MTIKTLATAALGLALTLAVTACSAAETYPDGDEATMPSAGATAEPADTTTDDAEPDAPEVDREPTGELPTITFSADGIPSMTAVAADPPTVITVKTLTAGDGVAVAAGDYVTVNYAGFLWSDGTQFDSSYDTGAPVGFSLDQVVEGWTYGLAGTRAGDRVLLVVPPDYGYGDEDTDSIPAGSTLVFVVDVLATTTVTTDALTSATPTDATLPAGLTVTGELGQEPTLTYATDSLAPTEAQTVVLAEGTGPVIAESDTLFYHAVGGYWGEETSSSWEDSYQTTDGGGGEETIGKRVGSRLLLIYPADDESDTAAEALVIDILAAIPTQ